MKITILSVGKKPHRAEQELLGEYQKRIRPPWSMSWHFIPHQSGDPESAKRTESTALLEVLPDSSFVILLDERGISVDNAKLVEILADKSSGKDIVIIIGGAYGVDERLHQRADYVVALSHLVMPHKLVRILVAEQLYRSQTIMLGHPYHHR